VRRARVLCGLITFLGTFAVLTSTALARGYAGEGWYGETTDQSITYAMYAVIAFFPTIIVLFSVVQWRLDRRKHARMAAAKRRAANLDWRGGW
jgi:uncharacterized membrane protein (GlpM family)